MTERARRCDNCGKDYTYARSSSKFCSRRCRSHAHIIRTRRVKIPADMRYSILSANEFTCRACGASPRKNPDVTLHVDHIVSLSDGGAAMDPRNLTVLCDECNQGKGKGT